MVVNSLEFHILRPVEFIQTQINSFMAKGERKGIWDRAGKCSRGSIRVMIFEWQNRLKGLNGLSASTSYVLLFI